MERKARKMNAKEIYKEAKKIIKAEIGFQIKEVDGVNNARENTNTILAVGKTVLECEKMEFQSGALRDIADMLKEFKQTSAPPHFMPGGKVFVGESVTIETEGPFPTKPSEQGTGALIGADLSLKPGDHIILYRDKAGFRWVTLYDSDEDRDNELQRIETMGYRVLQFYSKVDPPDMVETHIKKTPTMIMMEDMGEAHIKKSPTKIKIADKLHEDDIEVYPDEL